MFLGDFEFFQWWKQTIMFQEASQKFRRDIVVRLLDESHQPIITYAIRNAWPRKIEYGNLNAAANEILIETMELVHEGIRIIEAN